MFIVTIGWTGAILYIIGYLLLSFRIIKATSILYHLINILGAMGLIFNAYFLKDNPNLIVNLAWLAIGTLAIIDIVRKKNELQS